MLGASLKSSSKRSSSDNGFLSAMFRVYCRTEGSGMRNVDVQDKGVENIR
jgi:hypothetical protein